MLALAEPAEAKIVYTPAHRYVLLHHPIGLDLNGDGIVDFRIIRSRFYDTETAYATEVFAVGTSLRNRVAGVASIGNTTSHTFYVGTAYALRAGQQIGSKLHFASREPITNFMGIKRGARGQRYFCSGPWNNLKHRYLGLKFAIKGKIHYGWARLNEWCNRNGGAGTGAEALLTGYAYETIPNKPIITGKTKGPDVITLEPGSLGALAAGASRPRR